VTRTINLRSRPSAADPDGPDVRLNNFSLIGEWFTFGVWLCMAAALISFVYVFGSPFPYFDDMVILASWATETTPTWQSLFHPWNGHVIPFTRLAIFGCWMLADGSLRPLLLCSAVVLIMASLWVLVELRTMNGRLKAEDCLIPLAMLGCHAYLDAIWAICWNNVMAASLTAMIAASILRSGGKVAPGGIAWLAAATSALAFQGGPGLLGAVGFIPAISFLAWKATRNQEVGNLRVVVAIGFLIALVAGLLIYEIVPGSRVPATGATHQSFMELFVRIARSLSLPAGWISVRAWPLTALLIGVSLGTVIWGALLRRPRVAEATLVALTLLPGLLICAGIATLRGGEVQPRYIGMAIPLWVPIHFGMQMAVSPKDRHLFRLTVIIVLAISYGYGLTPTMKDGRLRSVETQALQAGIKDGQSFDQLATAHAHAWGKRFIATHFSENLVAISLLGKGDIARIPPIPKLTFITARTAPAATPPLPQNDSLWHCPGGGVMHISIADEKMDAIRLVFDVAPGNYGLGVGIGACRTDSQTWQSVAYESRIIYPDEKTNPGERPVYTLTYPLPPGATAVVLVLPEGCRDIKLRRLEAGHLDYEGRRDGSP
jgi:hypothetical protein